MILDGKEVAENLYKKLRQEKLSKKISAKLSVVLVGDDPASQTYVRNKSKKCEELGFLSDTILLPSNVSERELLAKVDQLNKDPSVHGILVQLPLPSHLNKYSVISRLNPAKDVDGLHPENVGRVMQGRPHFVPCTPAGVMEILRYYKIGLSGKHAVVIGRSDIVGKPMALLLLQENATVTICHSKTKDLEKECSRADILIAAIGKPNAINGNFVKPGAVVIDVGINRVDGKLVGDVDFAQVSHKASAITPVPGGVGPMTIACLMRNLLQAASAT